ncbi:MAG: cytochrome c [Vicinamibacterales bacterium]|nr:cytochrome c [Vicinamibacterales bacterium]
MGLVLALGWSAAARGQEPPKTTVWDRVYTEEQAKRGEAVYAKSCAACHGDALIGGNAPPLKGDEFAFLWGDKPIGELFERMKTLMPPESPDSLPNETYRDLVAFVMKANRYPSGDKELPADQALLSTIFITAKP